MNNKPFEPPTQVHRSRVRSILSCVLWSPFLYGEIILVVLSLVAILYLLVLGYPY